MRIETKVFYLIGGCQFDSETKAREWLYDQIGNLMDNGLSKTNCSGSIGSKERIAIVDAMVKNARQLAILLDALNTRLEQVI